MKTSTTFTVSRILLLGALIVTFALPVSLVRADGGAGGSSHGNDTDGGAGGNAGLGGSTAGSGGGVAGGFFSSGASGPVGTSSIPNGGNGGDGGGGGGGGGGGANGTVILGIPLTFGSSDILIGGHGGNGGAGNIDNVTLGGGGGGGAGGYGVIATGESGSNTNGGTVIGGTGGVGGLGSAPSLFGSADGGDGGDGGVGLYFSSNASGTLFINFNLIQGGLGGAGGVTTDGDFGFAGTGGAGGDGLFLNGANTTFVNQGIVTAGSGGAGGISPFSALRNGTAGANGVGVVFSGGAGNLVNYDTITGGVLMGNFANTAALLSGSVINGNLNMSANTGTTLTLDGTGTQIYSVAVTGTTTFAGALIKQGAGTWILDQAFTNAGGTSVTGGTLQLGDGSGNGSLISSGGGTDAVTVSSAAILDNHGGTITGGTGVRGVNTFGGPGGAGVVINSSATSTNSGVIMGGTGGMSGVSEGDPGGNGGSGVALTTTATFTNSGSVAGGAGGNAGTFSHGNGGDGGAGMLISGGGTLLNDTIGTISGGLAGAGVDGEPNGDHGPGVQFTGAAGVLVNKGAINNGVSMANFANTVTLFNGSTITGGLNMGTSTATTLTFDGTGTQAYSAAVAGATTFSGALVKQGAGTWTVDEALSYSGDTTIRSGTLAVDTGGSITQPGASLYVGYTSGDNGTFIIQNGSTVSSNVGYLGFDGNSNGTVTVTGTGSAWDLGTLEVSPGPVAGGGIGTLTISNGGSVTDQFGSVGNRGGATVTGNGSTLNSTAFNFFVTNGAVTVANGGTIEIQGGTGTMNLLSSGAGFQVVLNVGAAVGSAPVAAGTFQVGTIEGDDGPSLVNFNHTGTAYVFSPNLTGILSVQQYAGTTVLTGTDTYTGATTINGGSLEVNGSLTKSAVTVQNGGTLAGSGTLGGKVTVASGGATYPGDPQVMTMGSVEYQPDSTAAFSIATTLASAHPPVAGTDYDQIKLTASGTPLQIDPGTTTLKLDLSGGTLAALQANAENDVDDIYVLYQLIQGTSTGAFSDLMIVDGENTYSAEIVGDQATFSALGLDIGLSYQADATTSAFTGGNDVAFDVTEIPSAASVPEPGTWGLMLGALTLLAVYRRQRPGSGSLYNHCREWETSKISGPGTKSLATISLSRPSASSQFSVSWPSLHPRRTKR